MALIKLESFEFVWEAELAKSLLESEGIQAFVFDGEHIRINWALSHALGGVRVMVNKTDFPEAQQILQNWRNGYYENQPEYHAQVSKKQDDAILNENYKDITLCQACGSGNLKPIYNSLKTLLFFLIVGPAPGKTVGKKCIDCSHKEYFE